MYKEKFADLPNINHTVDDQGQPKFVICSWRVNDAKGDMRMEEFYKLCQLVLAHREISESTLPYRKCQGNCTVRTKSYRGRHEERPSIIHVNA